MVNTSTDNNSTKDTYAKSRNRIEQLTHYFVQADGHHPKEQIAKHQKMASSPFLFLRGSAPLFYADIQRGLLALPCELLTVPLTTIMGDCHSANFGFFTEEGSHGDNVIFAVNDFDDACIGHAVWDLARFITSLQLCALHCQGVVKGIYSSEKDYQGKKVVTINDASHAAQMFLTSYIDTCRQCHQQAETRYQILNNFNAEHILAKRYQKAVSRAANNDGFKTDSTLAKAVELSASPLKFKQLTERFQRLNEQEYQQINDTFAPYVDDSILDIVGRLNAGTGSVNMARYYLLVGPRAANKAQLSLCHIVEVKQQRISAPVTSFTDLSPINSLNPAHLTVNCQRRMQRNPDLVLDEVEWQGQHWLVRSRHHAKVGIKPEQIAIGKKATEKGGFKQYAETCGQALALAHCRGDRRSTLFEQAVLALLPQHQSELIASCQAYAKQVVTDTELLNQLLLG